MVHRIAQLAPSLPVAESIAATAPPSSPLSLPGGTCLRGTVEVPGDKSISHRALLFGAIAEGTTRIEGLLPAEDPLSTAACLRACAISLASASILTEILKGKDLNLTQKISEEILGMIKNKEKITINSLTEDQITTISSLAGVQEFPMRVKCATMVWHTFLSALNKKN